MAVMKMYAMNQGTDSLVPRMTIAPIGASNAHSDTPEALTKLPIDHCITNGVNRNMVNCSRQKIPSLRVFRKKNMLPADSNKNVIGMPVENRSPKLQ